MIGIGIRTVSGIDLDLAESSKLTIEWVSTVLNESTDFKGSYSYPVDLPFTDKNKSALGNAHMPENRLARKEEVVIVTVFGHAWKRCLMTYDITANGFDADVKIDNGEFAEMIKEKDLPSLFTIYVNGEFRDHAWYRLGNTKQETLNNIADSQANVGKFPCVFFPIRNEIKFGSYSGPENQEAFLPWDYINPIGFATDEESRKRNFYTPFFYLKWVLEKLCYFLGFEPAGDFFAHDFVNSLVIYNTGCYDVDQVTAADGFKIAPARHLPRIKLNEFIKALRQDLRLAIYFDSNERKAWFNFSEDLLEERELVNIGSFTDPTSLKIKRNNKVLYELKVKPDNSDDLYTIYPYTRSYFIGAGEKPTGVEMGFGTTYMRSWIDPGTQTKWRTPWARQTVNIYSNKAANTDSWNDPEKPYEYSRNDFGFRLLSYKGLVQDVSGKSFPYATADHLDQFEVDTYEFSLMPNGEKGLLNRFNRQWYAFLLETEEHELNALLPEGVLNQINPLKKLAYVSESKVIIPALFNKVAFESGSLDMKRILCKFSVFPHFNVSALRPAEVQEFSDGQISGDEPLWVRLVEKMRWTVTNTMKKREDRATYELEFYLDEQCTLPKSVVNQKVKYIEHYRGQHSRNFRDDPVDVICNGTKTVIKLSTTILWMHVKAWASDEYYSYSYELDASAAEGLGYKVVNGGKAVAI